MADGHEGDVLADEPPHGVVFAVVLQVFLKETLGTVDMASSLGDVVLGIGRLRVVVGKGYKGGYVIGVLDICLVQLGIFCLVVAVALGLQGVEK